MSDSNPPRSTIEDKLNDILKNAEDVNHEKRLILSLITTETTKARIDELERMHEKSFGWKRNKQLISGFVEDYYERLAALQKEQKR